jgi:hypothetical protein
MCNENSVAYTAGMSADAALGAMSLMAGMGRVMEKLEFVASKQQEKVQAESMPSHLET